MRHLKLGFFFFAFFYPVCLFSFSLFTENACPKLTAPQMCRISSGKNSHFRPNHASKNLLRHTCHMDHESAQSRSNPLIFEGTLKGALCECHYSVPKEWQTSSFPLRSPFVIYARTVSPSIISQEEMICPRLSFQNYKTLVTGHTFEDTNGLLWRFQDPTSFRPSVSNTPSSNLSSSFPSFIESIQKNIFVICRYAFNNLPITIQKRI